MRVAIFSGFDFHYEMFGYIIYYCKNRKFSLTIYCPDPDGIGGFMDFYNKTFAYYIDYQPVSQFDKDKQNFDCIFLTTDDDPHFRLDNPAVQAKTICIDHYCNIRNTALQTHIATRPFPPPFYRPWALPTYPILNALEKRSFIPRNINTIDPLRIVILGDNGEMNCNTAILNRLKTVHGSRRIRIHAISRGMHIGQFRGLTNPHIDLEIHKNIPTPHMLDILFCADYIITGLAMHKDYISHVMSGAIPFSFGTLTPLILPKESNALYRFQNAIEYDMDSRDDIFLTEIHLERLEAERDAMVERNGKLFTSFFSLFLNKF